MLSRFVLVLIEGASRSRQMFKISAPFVILASVFATLNARLGLPPFSLFLMALTLTDGEWRYLSLFDDRHNIGRRSINSV